VAFSIILGPAPYRVPSLLPLVFLSNAVLIAYGMWVDHCYLKNGWYPYPVLETVKGGKRLALTVILATVIGLLEWIFAGFQGTSYSRFPV
jgi:hypothetical protein